MGLAGCSVNKNSRAYLEGKAAELDRVFPTENLEDLFEEFPGGFHLGTLYLLDEDNDYAYTQDIEINGDSNTGKIIGTIKNVKSTDKPTYHEEVLKESTFEYKNSRFIFENPEFTEDDIANEGVLLQHFIINKDVLSKAKLLKKSYRLETGDAMISYSLSDIELNKFLKTDSDEKVDIIIDIDNETIHKDAFQYGINLKYDEKVRYTIGFSGYQMKME